MVPSQRSFWGLFQITRFFSSVIIKRVYGILALSNRIITARELSGVPQTKIRTFYPGVYTGAKMSVDAVNEKHPFSVLFIGGFNRGMIVSVGNVYGDEKWKLFSGCDRFVYPGEDHISISGRATREEQTAASVREAMASGIPVLVSESGSLAEIWEDREQVFRQGSVIELHDKFLAVCNSPQIRTELARRNLERSSKLFSMNLFSESLEKIVEGLNSSRDC